MKEDAELHSYGWVDKNAGTVHIPIEDAMRLMLERGAAIVAAARTPSAAATAPGSDAVRLELGTDHGEAQVRE